MRHRAWLVAVGGSGLPRHGSTLVSEPLTGEAWTQFRLAVRHQRLSGLAVQAADAGELPVTDKQREELVGEHLKEMAHALRLERHIVGIAEVLEPHGIAFIVLKGSAVAHLDYENPTLRSYADVDLLFRPEQLDRALDIVIAAGYERQVPPLNSGFDRRFGKGATLRSTDDYEIDVHRTFAMGPFGHTVDLDDLWDRPAAFPIAGRDISALATEQRMIHACFHAVVGNPHDRVQPRRDVAEMFLFGAYDSERVLELAHRWQAQAVVATALTDAWELFGVAPRLPLVDWAASRIPTRREVRMMSVYDGRTSYATKSLASLMVIPWRDRLTFLRMLTAPDTSFLQAQAQGRSRAYWLVRGTFRAIRHR